MLSTEDVHTHTSSCGSQFLHTANLPCRATLGFQREYKVLCSVSCVGTQCSKRRRKCHWSVSERLELCSVLMRVFVCMECCRGVCVHYMSVHVEVYVCIHICMCVGVLNVNVYLWGCL